MLQLKMCSINHFSFVLMIISIINLSYAHRKNILSHNLDNLEYHNTLNYQISQAYNQVFEEIQKREDLKRRSLENWKGVLDECDSQVDDWIKVIQTHPALRNLPNETCVDKLGCFKEEIFLKNTRNEFKLLPIPDRVEEVEINLINAAGNAKIAWNFDRLLLRETPFDPKLRNVFIIHGWQAEYKKGDWQERFLDNFYNTDPVNGFNVFILDWSEGASSVTYFPSIVNGKIVGAQIAYFISGLCLEFDLKIDSWQFVGHSLGAHMSGWISRRLRELGGKVARITALDPAKPGFESPGDRDRERLDSSCATLVDVIHTDAKKLTIIDGFGIEEPIGHFDFYPNGGSNQPNCRKLKSPDESQVGCSHRTVTDMIDQFDDPNALCLPVAYSCSSYKTFLEGKCASCGNDGQLCKLMGLFPDYWRKNLLPKTGENKALYVKTNAELRCLFHYQIVIHITPDTFFSSNHTTNDILLELKLNYYEKITFNFQKVDLVFYTRYLEGGRKYTALYSTNQMINFGKYAGLSWDHLGIHCTCGILTIDLIEINYMSHTEEAVRHRHSAFYYPLHNSALYYRRFAHKLIICEPKTKNNKIETNYDNKKLNCPSVPKLAKNLKERELNSIYMDQ